MMTRRQLLKAGVLGGGALVVPVPLAKAAFGALASKPGAGGGAVLTPFVDALPIPPVVNGMSGGSFAFDVAAGVHQFHSALPQTVAWGYAGAGYLGPTFEVFRGTPIDVTWTNRLGAHPMATAIDTNLHGAVTLDRTQPRMAVHLHGGNTSPANDGGPTETFLPGNARTYHYTNDQEASLIWYHDHSLGITRLNVYAGLAGLYMIRDARELALLLPGHPDAPGGRRYEVPLVLQDRFLAADGSETYPPAPWIPEFFGNIAVINGKAWPYLDVDRGWYRFRVVNGSNARFYDLHLSNGQSFLQIGGDGSLLPSPVALTHLVLAPGERADLLVDFSNRTPGEKIILTSSAAEPYPSGKRSARLGAVRLTQLMQFRVTSTVGYRRAIPSTLRPPIPQLPLPVAGSPRVRPMSLVEVLDEDTPIRVTLNNQEFETDDIARPTVDTVERWDIINTTGDSHPIHLHLVQVQILQRQPFDADAYRDTYYANPAEGEGPLPVPDATPFLRGSPRSAAANERGWKDTVRVDPGEVTSLLIPFGAGAAPQVPFGNSFTGDYVWHCHILEHEDNEMMLRYEVVP